MYNHVFLSLKIVLILTNLNKQRRPWSDAALCCILSMSSLLAKVPIKGVPVNEGWVIKDINIVNLRICPSPRIAHRFDNMTDANYLRSVPIFECWKDSNYRPCYLQKKNICFYIITQGKGCPDCFLVCDGFLCFVTFLHVILGQVWYVIVSSPDICLLP